MYQIAPLFARYEFLHNSVYNFTKTFFALMSNPSCSLADDLKFYGLKV